MNTITGRRTTSMAFLVSFLVSTIVCCIVGMGLGADEVRQDVRGGQVENYSHLKNKIVVFLGSGIGKISMYHPEYRSVVMFDHPINISELRDKLKEMLKDRPILEVNGVRTAAPYSISIGTEHEKEAIAVERDGEFRLMVPGAMMVPNFCELRIGINEIGIMAAKKMDGEKIQPNNKGPLPTGKSSTDSTPAAPP